MLEVIPCALGAHIGEQITLGFLKQNLPSGVILTNYHHPDRTGTLEIDLVVVNYQGVWLMEVKHWWGRIVADSVHWMQGERKHHSPLTKIDTKAKVVFSDLNQAGLRDVSVVGLVVLSKGIGTLQISDPRRNRVFGLNDDLVRALTGRDLLYSSRSTILKGGHIQRIVDTLVGKHVDPEWKIVGSYRLVEPLESGEGFDAFEGEHIHVQNRHARVKRYHIQAVQSHKHLQESIRCFKRDIETLARLEGHPNIVHAYDFLPDPNTDDTYWLLLEHVEGKTLREVIDLENPLSLEEQMNTLIPVADALSYCHEQNVLHRNLNPRAIYIIERGSVKLGDFDFARVPALGYTVSQTGVPLVQNKYIAPEQLTNPRQADHRADIYSLGAIWYDLVLHRPENEPVLISKIDKADIPKEACDLMRNMLTARPGERPESVVKVKEWFEILKE